MKTWPQPGKIALWKCPPARVGSETSPEALAALHPLWSEEVKHLQPVTSISPDESWLDCGGSRLAPGTPGMVLLGQCSSSLDAAWELAKISKPENFNSLLCACQNSGRGQLRRNWFSPAGNIYGSIFLPPPPAWLDSRLSLALGGLLADFFASLGLEAKVKWPNDILVNGKKICGLLIEERAGVFLAGIGINLALAPPLSEMREESAAAPGSLAGLGVKSGPLELWTSLVEFLKLGYLTLLSTKDSGGLTAYLEERLAWLGREVLISREPLESLPARLEGLCEDGGLKLARLDGSGEFIAHSGGLRLI